MDVYVIAMEQRQCHTLFLLFYGKKFYYFDFFGSDDGKLFVLSIDNM